MSEAWTWTYLDEAEQEISGESLVTTAFPSQTDAETWFGEEWRELAEAGVHAVVLKRDGETVYGPMKLEGA
ncbi:hypothetical protein ACQP1U_07260 [Actinomycetota bacterium]|nr:hypothetical protein [Micrococcales bacterium]